jgi:hypothetical protein
MQRTFLRLLMTASFAFAACVSAPAPTSTPEPPPTLTSTPVPTSTLVFTATPTLEALPTDEVADATEEVVVEPIIATDLVAPIRIDLPEGWLTGSASVPADVPSDMTGTALMLDEGLGIPFLPFTSYKGPVTGGTGFITVVWGFQNITTAFPGMESQAQIYLRGDGIRLLNLAVLEAGCNVGLDVDREFMIGQVVATGTYFAADNCPALEPGGPRPPDVKGWFAVTQQNGINFAFYAYTEPAEAMDGDALTELQAILDTVVFDMSLLPEKQATEETQP